MNTTNTKTAARPVKKEGYSFAKQAARRELRRMQAEQRNAVYQGLSLEDRMNRAILRRGQSARELTRLAAQRKARDTKKGGAK